MAKRCSIYAVLAGFLLVGTAGVSQAAASMDELEKSTADKAFAAAPKGKPNPAWKGQTFTIATLAAGPRGAISGPLYFWKPYFEKLTGATYRVVEIAFGDMQAKIETDFASGAGQYDAVVGGQFMMGDYVANDWIIPIDKYLNDPSYPKMDLDSIAPAYKALDRWGDHWYAFNNDHDGMILYYRRDLFNDKKWQDQFQAKYKYALPNPPKTWQQLLDVASFFNSVEWNGPGKEHQGISLHLKVGEQGFFDFLSIAAPYVVSAPPGGNPKKVTRYHNVFWFDPTDMKPLVNTAPFVKALETEIALYKAGSSAQLSWALGEAWNAFLGGQAAMCYSFGDVTPLAESAANSVIKGKVGASPTPGSTRWCRRPPSSTPRSTTGTRPGGSRASIPAPSTTSSRHSARRRSRTTSTPDTTARTPSTTSTRTRSRTSSTLCSSRISASPALLPTSRASTSTSRRPSRGT